MRKFIFFAVVLLLLGSLGLLAYYRSGPPTTLEGLYDEYHRRGLQAEIQSPFNGVVLVARDDEVVFERAYGFADAQLEKTLTLDSRFLIGAAAKPITALLVLQQVDAGVLALDGTVAEYLPDVPANPGKRITIHHLLSHTSGLPRDPEEWDEVELDGAPGGRYSFSNFGYDLLVSILETATGRGYGELVDSGIAGPLGLTDTGFAEGDALAAEVAQGMDFDKHPYVQSFMFGGGGKFDDARRPSGGRFYTSAPDLHRIVRAMRDGELLSAEMTEKLFAPNLQGYAYGWARNREWAIRANPDAPLYTHVGRSSSYNSVVGLYDDGTTVIVLSNVDPLDVATVLRQSWLAAHGMAEAENTLGHPSLGGPKRFLREGGSDAFVAYYEGLSERAGYRIDPSADFCEQVVRLLARAGELDEAAAFADKTIENGWVGGDEETLNSYGYVFLQRDRYDDARRYFERNVELHPEDANAHDSLGECHQVAGNLEGARESYGRALEIARSRSDSMAGFYERRLASAQEGADIP